MKLKKIIIGLFLILSFILISKVFAETVKPDLAANISSVENVKNLIIVNTPDFIKKPIIYITDATEKFRNKKVLVLEKQIVKANLDLNNSKIKLYFYNTIFFIVKDKILFYAAILVIILIILRFVWYKIF